MFLKQAYGGDDGWTFIEECSYKLLIDSILEEQEKSGRENSEPKPLESSDPTLLVENQVSEVNGFPLFCVYSMCAPMSGCIVDGKIELGCREN